jgi:A/G-specific adenine glycosylase
MHKAAQLMKNHEIFHLSNVEGRNLKDEDIFSALRSMPGVGDYTAGAVASFAFNLPYPALDGNVYRVLSRLYDCEIAFDTTQGKKHFRKLAEELLDRERPRLFNSAIMELGALVCLPTKPMCNECPLRTWCKALVNNTVELLPVRKPRAKVKDRFLEYTIYISPENKTLIHQRKGNDIWKHLWEFPMQEIDRCAVDRTKGAVDRYAVVRTKGAVDCCAEVLELTHVLSHQKLHVRFVIKIVPELPRIPDTIVVSVSDLDNYAFSRLTLKAIAYYF